MKDENLQILLDIQTSHSFEELQSRTAARLTALQMSMVEDQKRRKPAGSLAELVSQNQVSTEEGNTK